jgi:hypothetical protein
MAEKTILIDLGGDPVTKTPRVGVYLGQERNAHHPEMVDVYYIEPGFLNFLNYLLFKKKSVIKNVNPYAILPPRVVNDKIQYLILLASEDGKSPFLHDVLGVEEPVKLASMLREIVVRSEEIEKVAERKLRIAQSREEEVLKEKIKGLEKLLPQAKEKKKSIPLLEGRIEEVL